MECSVCYRQYSLSPTPELVLPKVGICGHSVCHQCCEQLQNGKNCPYCQHSKSFEWQSRSFLAEDCLTMIENADLIGLLLPELKQLIQELEDKKVELKNGEKLYNNEEPKSDLKSRPTGLISWLKRSKSKEKKAINQLQEKLDRLIDITTAIFRPKMMVPTQPAPFGRLYLEARYLQDLPIGYWIYGTPTEIAGCVWRMYICKRKEQDQSYFAVGIDMETDKDSTKKFNGSGSFDIISQRHNVIDERFRLNCMFEASIACQEIKRRWKWESIIDGGYVANDRVFIQCQQWNVKEIVETT